MLLLAWMLVSLCQGGCGDPMAEARGLEDAGDWQGALAIYRQVLEESPDDLGALSGAAVALMALHSYDDALELQERVVVSDPSDVATRVELGLNYLGHQDRPADAVRVLGEAVDLESSARNLTFLAQAQEVSGDCAGAEETLRRAIEVDPRYAYAYSRLSRMLGEQGRFEEEEQLRADAQSLGVTFSDLPQ